MRTAIPVSSDQRLERADARFLRAIDPILTSSSGDVTMSHGQSPLSGRSLTLASVFIAAALPARAQDEGVARAADVLVTASRVPIPREAVGSAATVIGRDEIESQETRILSDVLREVPGISVNRSGNAGSLTQVRLRGAEANQTLVLVDGIEIANPVTGEFNFADLLTADVERIEVIRGEQSALWGSDAIGGVINVITKKGEGPLGLAASAEYGSFDTYSISATLSGGGERYDHAFTVSRFETDGTNIARGPGEDDGYENTGLSFKGGVTPVPELELGLVARYIRSENESDADVDFDGFIDDSDRADKGRQWFGRAHAALALFDGRWRHEVSAAYTDSERTDLADGARIARRDGEKEKYSYETTLRFDTPEVLSAGHRATFLVEYEDEDFANRGATGDAPENQDRSIQTLSFVGEYGLDLLESLFLSAAVRHDDNDRFKDRTTYRVTAAALLGEAGTRVHASYGTGVKNPTFFELFGFIPDFFQGNPDLRPERSEGFDVGVEQSFLGERLVLDVTYFNAELEDEVFTDFSVFPSTAGNRATESDRQGVEVSARYAPRDDLSFAASYTFTDSEEAGRREVRRPRHVGSVNGTYRFLEGRAAVTVSADINGRQDDIAFTPPTFDERVKLGGYALVNVTGRYRLTDEVELFARIENLLDENYEEVFGFTSSGIAAFAGLRLALP